MNSWGVCIIGNCLQFRKESTIRRAVGEDVVEGRRLIRTTILESSEGTLEFIEGGLGTDTRVAEDLKKGCVTVKREINK